MVKTFGNADYRTPVCEVLEIAAEGLLCGSPAYGDYGEAGQGSAFLDPDFDL